MIEKYVKAQVWLNDLQIMAAIIFGMIVQFILGVDKNRKVLITIIVSSLFLAIFILPAILELIKIDTDNAVARSLYALSSVMSIELLALIIRVLPNMVKDKFANYLGVK